METIIKELNKDFDTQETINSEVFKLLTGYLKSHRNITVQQLSLALDFFDMHIGDLEPDEY